MAIHRLGLVSIAPSPRSIEGGSAPAPTPFRVSVIATNDANQTADIKISRYSSVLASPNISDKVPIIGVDLKINIAYADKLWLEIFYDRNLVPVFCLVNKGRKWASTVTNPTNSNEQVNVYPNELEFITKIDMSGKLADLETALTLVDTYRAAALEEVTYQKNTGVITEDSFSTLTEAIGVQYQTVSDLINDYKKNMNKFFEASPSGLWKKLFRTYTLIAYTTHETSAALEGQKISPRAPVEATTPTIPQVSEPIAYKIVQCLNNDLLLADMCFQNRYPAKIALPYHRPVYYFADNGKNEEAVNTA